jgi:hypothetical protein
MKKLQELLNSISNVIPTDKPGLEDGPHSYVSKTDGSYLTFVGSEANLMFLLKFGITEQIQSHHEEKGSTASIGFNPITQKWYGWSHRAIYGFGIGSVCQRGMAGFKEKSKEDFVEQELIVLQYLCKDSPKIEKVGIKEHTVNGVEGVITEYHIGIDLVESSKISVSCEFQPYPPLGKGEWTARTLSEAKEMAINFAEDVS